MRLKARGSIWRLVGSLLLLAGIYAAGYRALAGHGAWGRYVAVPDLDAVGTTPPPGLDVLSRRYESRDVRGLLREVMDSVPRIGPCAASDPAELLAHVRDGGGLYCSGMAWLFFGALGAEGHRARIVTLARNLYDPCDTHTTVEVLEGGRWVLYDPTFHVSFQKGKTLLGAQDVMESLHAGSFPEVRPVFHGEVAYPARLERYPMHWLPLFNNVFVYDRPCRSFLCRLPPLRYWFGPRAYFEPTASNRGLHFPVANGIYLVVAVVVPILALAVTAALLRRLAAELLPFRPRSGER